MEQSERKGQLCHLNRCWSQAINQLLDFRTRLAKIPKDHYSKWWKLFQKINLFNLPLFLFCDKGCIPFLFATRISQPGPYRPIYYWVTLPEKCSICIPLLFATRISNHFDLFELSEFFLSPCKTQTSKVSSQL